MNQKKIHLVTDKQSLNTQPQEEVLISNNYGTTGRVLGRYSFRPEDAIAFGDITQHYCAFRLRGVIVIGKHLRAANPNYKNTSLIPYKGILGGRSNGPIRQIFSAKSTNLYH